MRAPRSGSAEDDAGRGQGALASRWGRPGRRATTARADELADESRPLGERGARRGGRGRGRCRSRSDQALLYLPNLPADRRPGRGRRGRQRGGPPVVAGPGRRPPEPERPTPSGCRTGRSARHCGLLDMERGAQPVRLDVPALPRAPGPGCCGRSPPSPSTATRRRVRGGPAADPGADRDHGRRPGTCPSSRRRPTTSSGTTCGRSRRPRCR